MATLRFAVMGTGFWANFQIPAWFEVGGVELVALYNRTRSRAEAMAAKCVSDWRTGTKLCRRRGMWPFLYCPALCSTVLSSRRGRV